MEHREKKQSNLSADRMEVSGSKRDKPGLQGRHRGHSPRRARPLERKQARQDVARPRRLLALQRAVVAAPPVYTPAQPRQRSSTVV